MNALQQFFIWDKWNATAASAISVWWIYLFSVIGVMKWSDEFYAITEFEIPVFTHLSQVHILLVPGTVLPPVFLQGRTSPPSCTPSMNNLGWAQGWVLGTLVGRGRRTCGGEWCSVPWASTLSIRAPRALFAPLLGGPVTGELQPACVTVPVSCWCCYCCCVWTIYLSTVAVGSPLVFLGREYFRLVLIADTYLIFIFFLLWLLCIILWWVVSFMESKN